MIKTYPNIGKAHPRTNKVKPTTPAKANDTTAANK